MKPGLKLFIAMGAVGAALYYAYNEYRSWWDITDRMLGSLEDIHLAFERLNGTAHRLESRMDNLVTTLESAQGPASTTTTHQSTANSRTPRAAAKPVSPAKPRIAAAKRNALHGTQEK